MNVVLGLEHLDEMLTDHINRREAYEGFIKEWKQDNSKTYRDGVLEGLGKYVKTHWNTGMISQSERVGMNKQITTWEKITPAQQSWDILPSLDVMYVLREGVRAEMSRVQYQG